MVRVIANDDLCCEITLNAETYNLIKLSCNKINTNLSPGITAIDMSSRVKNGDLLHAVIGLHESNENAHKTLFNKKADILDLSDVATSGDYNDLKNKPVIPTVPAVNNATLTITQGGTTKGTFTANASSDVTISLENSGATRNIGEIVQSTIPLTDAGLHLLDGALISGSGSYSTFVDYIADLYDSGDYTAIFETEANWQTAVTNYGVCGKFVYDSVNNTVRLPKYSNKIFTSDIENTASVKGTGMTLGLTDGTNNLGLTTANGGNMYGVMFGRQTAYGTNAGTTGTATQGTNGAAIGITTDGTKSGIFADLSDITTSLDGYYYIVVATSTKTEIEVDIDEIATDLNGKADTDLSNVPNSKGILEESYVNGTSWYRVYSDGWCEQGGTFTGTFNNASTFSLLKAFKDTNYTIVGNAHNSSNLSATWSCVTKGQDYFTGETSRGTSSNYAYTTLDWVAYGYIR